MKVDRQVVHQGVELSGVDLGKHIRLVTGALKTHAEALGIGGKGA